MGECSLTAMLPASRRNVIVVFSVLQNFQLISYTMFLVLIFNFSKITSNGQGKGKCQGKKSVSLICSTVMLI